MKGLITWIIVAGIGFAVMAFSYFNYQYQPGQNPWEYAFMYIGKGDPNSEFEGMQYAQRPIRLSPISQGARHFTKVAKGFGLDVEKSYRVAFQEKLVLYPDIADDFTGQMLEWGRLPATDANEVVAGFTTSNKGKIAIHGHIIKVVGQFKKEVRLFANSYLIGNSAAADELFNPEDDAVQNAYIFQFPKEELARPEMRKQLKKAFPKSQFTTYVPLIQTEQIPFYIYILGMALLFSGGSVALFKAYCFLSEKVSNKWLRLPLAEIRKSGRLFLGLHLVYFGLVVLFMLLVYTMPELQVCFLAGIKA